MKTFSFGLAAMVRFTATAVVALALVACADETLPGPEVGELVVSPSNVDLLTGDSRSLVATTTVGSAEVSWVSSAPEVASVTNGGVVTAVATGQAVVTATLLRDRSKVASAAVIVRQKYFPLAATYDLTFTFDSTRFEVTAPNGGCPTTQGYCTYTRPTGLKSTLAGSMRVLDSTFTFTPTFPSGPSRLVSIAEVTLSGRFCSGPDLATPVGCTMFEDVPQSRHTALIARVTSLPSTANFVRIDSGTVSGDFPTGRFLSLTSYDVTADSVYGRFLWILHRSVRSPTAQLGSFVAKRRATVP